METKMMWRRLATTVAASLIAGAGAVSSSTAADVPFDFLPDGVTFTQSGTGAGVNGGHPDVTIGFVLQSPNPSAFATATNRPPQAPRSATVTLPAGLIGDPTAVGATCPMDKVILAEKKDGLGLCPRASAAGVVAIEAAYPATGILLPQERRIWRTTTGPNEVAAFGTSIISVPVRIGVSVTPSGGYRVRATAEDLTQAAIVRKFQVTLWGVPAEHQGPGPECDGALPLVAGLPKNCILPIDTNPDVSYGGRLADTPLKPFMSNPSVCAADLAMDLRLVPYGTVFGPIERTVSAGTLSGCENQPFSPSVDVTPKSSVAGQPTGLTVGLNVPQNTVPTGLAAAHVKDVSVTLPQGVAISPPSANGLDACSDAQLDLEGDSDPACPDASRIGSLKIDTPVLEEPVRGHAYLGTQLSQDPMSGEMYRLFLVAKTGGVLIKLKGAVKANPATGQLTATFENNPQLPFSRMELRLDDGPRASLATPRTCGTYTTTATISSWSGKSRNLSSSFTVDQGCPTGRFAPTLSAGTAYPLAGAFSPFNMTVSRTDADQDLSRLNLELPSGVLAALGSVPLCGEAQANAGTCGAASRIGSTNVLVGSGAEPLPLTGQVYVTGPYKGAPFGLSVVVPAKVGPFDLGTVVVRGQLLVNAARAQVTAVTDPFPTIVGGVPVRLRQVGVSMDRPGFTFNATSCARQQITSALWSPTGASSVVGATYQAQACERLDLRPSLKIGLSGSKEFKKGGHPTLTAELSQTRKETNLNRVKVVLPPMLALAADNAQALCKPEQAAARSCPEGSIVGEASARTPALHLPLSGPVYFVENTRRSKEGRVIKTLPKLWMKLAGEGVTLDLYATSEIDSRGKVQRLVTTFDNVPDAPIDGFRLKINGGKHGILAATDRVCALSRKKQKGEVTFTGQNQGVLERRVTFEPTDCGLQTVSKALDRSRVRVRVAGLSAGRLTISGKGIKKHSRTVKRATAATIAGRLTATGKRLARDGKALRPKVSFNPKAKGKKTVSVKTTVKRTTKKKSSSR